MALLKEEKQKLIEQYRRDFKDVGSPEVQIAVLTEEIKQLTEHLKAHKHDRHSERGLMQKVGKRRRLMKYLQRENPKKYQELIERLDIRG